MLLTAFCILQGLGTIVLDLNRTHATHPQWLGHARFHVVWQTATAAALAIVECALLWISGPAEATRFHLAAVLASLPMLGFLAALFTSRIYGGTLSDPGGIPPLGVSVAGRQITVDLNLVAVITGLVVVPALAALYQFAPQIPQCP